MKDEVKFKVYADMIADLDRQHEEELKAQPEISGNNRETHEQIGERMKAQISYERKRQALTELQADAQGVSLAVEAYLKPDTVISKFKVDNGDYTPDESLDTPGKKL